MKKMVLTGLATEQSFSEGLGEASFFIVFNDGEVRVPISKEAAEIVISAALDDNHLEEAKNENTDQLEEVKEFEDEEVDDFGLPQI